MVSTHYNEKSPPCNLNFSCFHIYKTMHGAGRYEDLMGLNAVDLTHKNKLYDPTYILQDK